MRSDESRAYTTPNWSSISLYVSVSTTTHTAAAGGGLALSSPPRLASNA